MRALLIAAALAIAASLAGFAQSTASAAPPVAVSIQIHPTVFSPVEIGTWDASGAINDAGSYERTATHVTGSLPDFFSPEHTGAFQETFVLTGSKCANSPYRGRHDLVTSVNLRQLNLKRGGRGLRAPQLSAGGGPASFPQVLRIERRARVERA